MRGARGSGAVLTHGSRGQAPSTFPTHAIEYRWCPHSDSSEAGKPPHDQSWCPPRREQSEAIVNIDRAVESRGLERTGVLDLNSLLVATRSTKSLRAAIEPTALVRDLIESQQRWADLLDPLRHHRSAFDRFDAVKASLPSAMLSATTFQSEAMLRHISEPLNMIESIRTKCVAIPATETEFISEAMESVMRPIRARFVDNSNWIAQTAPFASLQDSNSVFQRLIESIAPDQRLIESLDASRVAGDVMRSLRAIDWRINSKHDWVEEIDPNRYVRDAISQLRESDVADHGTDASLEAIDPEIAIDVAGISTDANRSIEAFEPHAEAPDLRRGRVGAQGTARWEKFDRVVTVVTFFEIVREYGEDALQFLMSIFLQK